ncbi:MAG TPA: hypothetical protein VEG66_01125 [Thermoplasmata archaeon]|jgi:hypothetical protein|nr:hypothetical protein [Thermoplasmata archaeon]
MIDPEVQAADTILRREGIRYVVVGGQAIAQRAATTTRDVDVMVATSDYGATVARLKAEPGLAFDWDDGKLCRFRFLALGGVPLDVINSTVFSGNRTGKEFFDFLASEGSQSVDGILYATPTLVWYTRLLTKRWRAYAEKIVTNVIDGVPVHQLDGVEEVAHRFGTDNDIGPRVAYVREELRRPEVAALLRPP